ncbi:MAG: VanZ family protein [Alphaproteobacteria bacterium]|nr:VanZ family protein [Alphaproteobacteria bacterium]
MNDAYDFIIWIYTYAGNFDTVIFALPFIILLTLIYGLARVIWCKYKFGNEFIIIRRKVRLNEIIKLVAFFWFCTLLSITITPTEFWMKVWINLINNQNPFAGCHPGHFGEIVLTPIILKYIFEGHMDWLWWSEKSIFSNLILNIFLFIPFGISMPFICSKCSFLKTALTGLMLSFFIEFIQFFLGRECEIDDLICNTFGASIGFIFYLVLCKIFPIFIGKCKISARQINKANFSIIEEPKI